MKNRSHPPSHFQNIYDGHIDPWNYRSSEYERGKRDATIAALRARRFHSAMEIGCSIGLLSLRLAVHCDRVLAVDFVESALAEGRKTCADHANVEFLNARVPAEWPSGEFDLIMLSEVLYFLTDVDSVEVAENCRRCLSRSGEIVLVNWLGKSDDDPVSGDRAAARFIASVAPYFHVGDQVRAKGFRIDKLHWLGR